MAIKLPHTLHRAFVESRREHQRGLRAALSVDRRLYTKLADAMDAGLSKIEACSPEDYDGPWREIVLRPDIETLSLGFEWATRRVVLDPERGKTTFFGGREYLAEYVVGESSKRDLDVHWLEIASAVPYCPNDACADHFERIIATDPGAVLWHVAASLHTWAHSGVWTPAILAETLDGWAAHIDDWCRRHAEVDDRYVSFMASYATRLLDGHVQQHDEAFLSTYIADIVS